VILYGPRQAGKTTFLRRIIDRYDSAYINCDIPESRDGLSPKAPEKLLRFVGRHAVVAIDEAQRVKDIGITLKILVDTYPEMQIIATGSSSFDLENAVAEPLTGRHYDFMFFPPLYSELSSLYASGAEQDATLPERLLYGSYPEVIFPQTGDTPRERIQSITDDYAMKDILAFEGLRKSDTLTKVLKVLAYQIGSEVSYAEIAQNFGVTQKTIERYIDILEKAFIVFRLPPYVGNKRTGLRRTRKVYFWDTGLRNALIRNFESLDLRPDKGALFENYIVSEMKKRALQQGGAKQYYFWRAYDGEEVDLVEESDGALVGYEIKWKSDAEAIRKSEKAPVSNARVIDTRNVTEILGHAHE
ncbi:ATP-binding protein, partial [Candidatus Kaiserbacteria bacterium]|nr:ATP-binding protein [Candidatus Kaiserbacteria bacterium]